MLPGGTISITYESEPAVTCYEPDIQLRDAPWRRGSIDFPIGKQPIFMSGNLLDTLVIDGNLEGLRIQTLNHNNTAAIARALAAKFGKPTSIEHDRADVAKSCPSCGANRKIFRRSPDAKKRMSWPKKIGIAFGAMFGLGLIGQLVTGGSGPGQAARGESEKERQADAQRGSVAMLSAKALKDSLRNPDSLAFVYIHTNDDGSVVCMKCRAQNGFGGLNIGYVVYKDGQPSESSASWHTNCVHKQMHDLTQVKGLI